MKLRIFVAVAAAAAATSSLAGAQPHGAAFPGRPGLIAFAARAGADWEIFTMAVDGSRVRQLTRNLLDDSGPAWSPDGERIAFRSDRAGNAEVFVMNADGTGVRRITRNPAPDTRPTWSPDGERIAFVGTPEFYDRDIYVMAADGTSVRRLTFSQHNALPWGPSWSPDGNWIVFSQTLMDDGDASRCEPVAGIPEEPLPVNPDLVRCHTELFVMRADGTQVTRLTYGSAWNATGGPDWSPEGRRIAFSHDRGDGTWGVYVVRPDGVVDDLGVDGREPDWSPDGTQIAFTRESPDGHSHVYVMDGDGSDVTAVPGTLDGHSPAWSPDGSKIAYTLYPSIFSFSDLFVIGVDGTGRTWVPIHLPGQPPAGESAWGPSWQRLAAPAEAP